MKTTDRQTDKQTDTKKKRQTDIQTDRDRERERERETERERYGERKKPVNLLCMKEGSIQSRESALIIICFHNKLPQ